MSRSHANPPRTQDQQDDVDSKQPGDALGALYAASNKMESLRLVNQRLLRELAELTRQEQRPQKAQQACEGHNTSPRDEQQHLGAPETLTGEEKIVGPGRMIPTYPPRDGGNEGMPGRDDRGEEPTPHQQGKGEQS